MRTPIARLRRSTPWLVCVAVLAPGALAAEEERPEVRVVTDVRERHYQVDGADAEAVFASIQRQGLGGEAGLSASGLTTSELTFLLSTSATSATCRLDSMTLQADVSVTLPKHVRPASLDASTRRHWEAYEALVEFHEYRHVEIEFQGVQELQAKLEREAFRALPGTAHDCRSFVEDAIREQTEITRRRHEEFHRTESRAVREAQSALLRKIQDIDARLASEKVVLDGLANDLQALEEERIGYERALDELVRRYGGRSDPGGGAGATLPPAELEYAQLMSEGVDLTTRAMNEVAEKRNARVTTYNEAVEERRHLASLLSWTR